MAKQELNQITDAVTQTNVKVVAEAPAIGLANVFQTTAHSSGLMFSNAVNSQHQQFINSNAATTKGLMQILNKNPITTLENRLAEILAQNI